MPKQPSKEEFLARVYDAKSNADLVQGYNGWSASYDSDLENYGYRLPGVVAALAVRYVPPDEGAILDAGAGTGLVGEWLQLLGYRDIVGIDLSTEMLVQAERRQAYKELRPMVLGETLDFTDGAFRAVVSAGTFSASHAPASAFDELLRVTQAGGHLVFSVKHQDLAAGGFRAKLDALEKAGAWQALESVGPFLPMLKEPEVSSSVFVYRAL